MANQKSVFKGISIMLIAAIPYCGTFFIVYDGLKILNRSFQLKSRNHFTNETLLHFIASGIAEGCAAFMRNPFEVVKQQVQVGWNSRIIDTVSFIYKSSGIFGFWTGIRSLLLREIPFMCIQFPIYEILRKRTISNNGKLDFVTSSINGFIAGGAAGLLTTPIDVVKTKIMTQRDGHYKGVADCFMKVYKEEGILEFRKGSLIRLFSLGICGNVFFAIYEECKKLFEEKKIF